MRTSGGERRLATLLIVPTALVVLLLAVVQYRWSTEVTNATSLRLADSLQMSMMSWQLNLFRDLADVCLRLRLDTDGIGGRDLEQAVQRFQTRQAAADYPDLVTAIYVIASDASLPVLHWDMTARRFSPLDDGQRLAATRAALISHAGASDTGGRAPGEGALVYTPGDLADWRFSVDLPGVLRPITTGRSLFESSARVDTPVAGWIVFHFDSSVLAGRVLPALASRYFSGPDGLDYEIALVGGVPRRVIYSSDQALTADPPDADGRMNLFGRAMDDAGGSAIRVFHQQAGTSAPPIPVSTAWLALVGDAPRDADWHLIVRHHRGGALGAFVEEVSRRNLAISFGLLLLLVISVAVWIILGNRVRRLARLEMSFVTAVSHDLRTPIAIISSAADNISQGVVQGQEQLSQYGAAIGTQTRKLSELVEQVLLFESVRQSATRYVPRPVDVSDVVDTTLAALSELIRAARVTVERAIPSGLPKVVTDPVGLSQCLQNLITNALKYGGEPRWLGIAAEVSPNSPREVCLHVRDHGIGIEPAELRYIFEPFYRSPAVGATKGTGLGLAVARSVAEAMNSRLTVESAPGEGSTFTLHLAAEAGD